MTVPAGSCWQLDFAHVTLSRRANLSFHENRVDIFKTYVENGERMRIIGGKFKGRKLHAPRGAAIRPTADRVREAIFNILA